MTWDLRQKELESVLALPIGERYAYFIKRVVDWGEIWGLSRDGKWVLAGDDTGRELFPIWPHPEFAKACVPRGWERAQPRAIEIHEFIEKWIPGLDADKRLIAVFPTPTMQGSVRSPFQLADDLQAELDLVE